MPPAVSSVLFFFLLLLPHLGNSYPAKFSSKSRRLIVRPQQALTPQETCSTIISGKANGNKLPLIHRSSPCSPLNNGAGKRNKAPSSADVLHRDAHRLRTILAAVRSGLADDAGDAPAPAPASGVTAPVAVADSPALKGGLDYSVMVGYGTPAQQLPMDFDILQVPAGVSTLRCKPCRAGAGPCDPAFDPSRSSSFARVPCGPECPSRCDGSATCSVNVADPNGFVYVNGTFVKDTLALSSATFTSFTLACVDVDTVHNQSASAGMLDLSRGRLSLVSQVTSSPAGNTTTAAFSYCLPASTTSTRGFLTVGGALPDLSGNGAGSTPLVDFPKIKESYVIELGGINVGGTELPAPNPSLAALEVGTSFTFLQPPIYTALRDEFRKQMAKYPVAPPPHRLLDTCYNFTGLPGFEMPSVWLEFKGGVTLTPDVDQMMYFPDGPFHVGCLAFAATPEVFPFSVIGNMAQQTVEVVYDVRGGKVGFIQQSC